MSTQSPSLTIMWHFCQQLHSKTHNSWLPYHLSLCSLRHFSEPLWATLKSYLMSKLFGHHSGYQLRLFTLHFNPQLCVSGYGHAQNDLYYLSHVYSMSQKLPVVIFHVLVCLSQVWILTQLLQLVPKLSLSFVFTTHGSLILVLQNLGQWRQWVAQHIHWGQSPIILQVLYLRVISILSRFQLCIFSIYVYPSWITA